MHQTDYIEIRPETPGVWTKDWNANLAIIGRVLGSWEGVKSIHRRTAYNVTVGCIEDHLYNGPPSRPHQFAFYDMQGEGCLLLPRSSTGTVLLDLRT